MTIRAQFVTLVCFLSLVPLALFAWAAISTHQRAHDEVRQELQRRAALQLARGSDERLDDISSSVESFATKIVKWSELTPAERTGALWLLYGQSDAITAVSLLDERGRPLGGTVHRDRDDQIETAGHVTADTALLQSFAARIPIGRAASGRAHGRPFSGAGRPERFLPMATGFIEPSTGKRFILAWLVSLHPICRDATEGAPTATSLHLLDELGEPLCAPAASVAFDATAVLAHARKSRDPMTGATRSGEELVLAASVSRHGFTAVVEQSADVAAAAGLRLRRQSTLWLAVSAFVALAAGLWLTKRIIQRVDDLAQTADRLAAGEYAHRAASSCSNDELGRLATAFNRMAEEVAQRDARIRGFNDELATRVEERTQELGRASARLVETERFAATASLGLGVALEVNKPLTGVLGMVQLLLARAKQETGRDRDVSMLAAAEREALRIRDMLRRLLALSQRHTADRFRRVAPNELVSSVVSEIQRAPASSEASITMELGAVPHVRGNVLQLQQALKELVTNALAAQPRSAPVAITTALARGRIEICVVDQGPGLSQEMVARAFEPFFTTHGEAGCAGLGLPIARRIVEAHGGSLKLASETGGSTIAKITLPAALRPCEVAA